MKNQLLNVGGLIALLVASSTYSAQAVTLFSETFDSYANGDLATTVPGVTIANFSGDSATISIAQSLSPNNSLLYTSDGAGAPDLFFNFSSPVTVATTLVNPILNISFSFQKVDNTYDPEIWTMFGGPNAGFANGNIGLRNNGLNNFFGSPDPGFQFTGQGANWLTVNVAYTFTNNGTNITGYTGNFTTSGGAQNPTFNVEMTGLNIASIDSLRLQFRGALGNVYIDNVSITAIPEPSTYALLALGFGAVFFLRRRRAA